jgi:hypothetical protein
MATFGALRPPWNRLLHPYRTHVLCPPNLCPNVDFPENFEGFCAPLQWIPLSLQGRGRGFDKPLNTGATRKAEVGYFMRTQV